MSLSILINNNPDPKSDYVTWTPAPCRIVSNQATALTITLRNKQGGNGGQLSFMGGQPFTPADSLTITLPGNGSADFFIAGKFNHQTGEGFASKDDKDVIIEIVDAQGNVLGDKTLMVRVRKNANELTPAERNRFLDAVVKMNQAGQYVDLQNMHLQVNSGEIHGRSCFLPWHRAFLLELERKLQEINPAVTIPYWQFDRPAPRVFIDDFMGTPDSTGMVQFSNTNPLINWRLQLFGVGSNMRVRRQNFNNVNPANSRAARVVNNESQTIQLGDVFAVFARQGSSPFDVGGIEGDPHGSAHVSFVGQISNIGQAPADPLFFLLHCNIDRLWARWQWLKDRLDRTSTDAYPRQGNGNGALGGENGIGNFTNDTMWPWNGVSGNPRPSHSVGTGMPASPVSNFPGITPKVGDLIDYQGQITLTNNLNFAYQQVPFDF